jgi:hypothetical protein
MTEEKVDRHYQVLALQATAERLDEISARLYAVMTAATHAIHEARSAYSDLEATRRDIEYLRQKFDEE